MTDSPLAALLDTLLKRHEDWIDEEVERPVFDAAYAAILAEFATLEAELVAARGMHTLYEKALDKRDDELAALRAALTQRRDG